MMTLTRNRRTLRLAVALAVVGLSLLVFASARPGMAATPSDTPGSCPAETASCVQVSFPCPGCSASAGPVANLGLDQAVYVQVSGVPIGDELELALCSLSQGDTVVAQPQCASAVPGPSGSPPTPSPLEYQYGSVTQSETVLSIPTEFDPDIAGGNPIVSQTADQLYLQGDTSSSFFCDNAANPCGVEIIDIPQSQTQYISGDGVPPLPSFSAVGHTAIIPITFGQGGSGCASAPIMPVDASYSMAEFLPAAGEATCTGSGGVAPIATELPSVDDPGCANGSGTHCPIYDVIGGNVPVTFTDDPEDPATLAEEKQAGGKLAYIPIALSATEIAFAGAAGAAGPTIFPLSSYKLTAAQAAGIMTQLWNAPVAGGNRPDDDLCGQLSGADHCTMSTLPYVQNLLVETAGGKSGNLDVTQASGGLKAKTLPFKTVSYLGNYDEGQGQLIGSKKAYYGDTGYALLNPWPFKNGNQIVSESALGAMWPSTGSGATFETTGWMCNAPNLHYTVNLFSGSQASVQDIMSGQQILADGEWDPVGANSQNGQTAGVVDQNIVVPAKKCQSVSTLPTDFAGSIAGVNAVYEPSSQPITAAHAVQGAVPKYSSNGGFAFTAMDSSQADFYGLLPASLQNVAGNFVDPNQSSLAAALNDMTPNADGTLSPSFNNTGDSAAYSLPMVTYALVSTAPQPTADQATQLKDLLTNLVTYSHTGGANTAEPLPAGYVPLPTNLYNQALADISTDVVGPGGSTSGGGSNNSSGGSSSPSSAGGGGGGGGGAGAAGSSGRPAGTGGVSGPARSATNGPAPSSNAAGTGSSPQNFVGHLITVTVGDSRFFVPALLLLGLLCLLLGPFLYLWPNLRKMTVGGGEAGSEASEKPDGPGESVPGPPVGG